MNNKPLLTSETYDKLKKLVQLVLPALGALYFGLSQLWDLPAAEEIVGTFAVFAAFFGSLLGISSAQYNNQNQRPAGFVSDQHANNIGQGTIVLSTSEEGKTIFTIQDLDDPDELKLRNQIVFDVRNE